ncbi:THO complex subunit 1-like [Lolium rigidum]|uniref:THO complex subunit 1-like n=1 Tax=Lolium rigidum TaxID=89674 RepID=UPI001F5C62C1|nr:THO complex subunit 1-like [Lolium rigidum]
MAEPSPPPPPPSNSGLRILLTKARAPTSSPSTSAAVSSHADRDRIIGVFRTALARNESPEAFALQAVQEAIKPQKQTVLVLEENQSLENALRRLLQELVSSAVQSDKGIMQYGNSLDSGESNCLITRLLDIMLYLCERGHVEGGMVFQLLEDLTDMSTIKDCKDVFGYIESKQDILGKQELFGRGKLVMLRTCNQLLRRLSKSNDVVFCGRIIMFLAHFFPLSERSALNIKGVFNTSNETKYEKDATDGISVDFNFYQTLWSLQEHFRNPALTTTNPTKWQKFASNLTVVLSTFEAQPLSDADGKHNNLEQEEDAAFNIKYLTSSKLMGLELKDASFRRHILVQCLIFFDYLKAPGKTDKDGPSESIKEEIKSCEERVKNLLEMIPPKGKEFLQSIEHILEREKNWVWWKRDGCPAFEKQPFEKKKTDQAVGRKRKLRWRLGNKELAQLWKWAELNPNALTDPDRVRPPVIAEYWKPLAEDMDTSAGIEEEYHHKNNRVYCWKGLRFTARQDLEAFSRFCDYGIEGVVPPELLPADVRAKFNSKPGEKAKRPKREDTKGTSSHPKEPQVAAATPDTDGGGSGDQEEGAVPMDSDNPAVDDGQKRSPGEVSGPESGQCEAEDDGEDNNSKTAHSRDSR